MTKVEIDIEERNLKFLSDRSMDLEKFVNDAIMGEVIKDPEWLFANK